MGRKKKNARSAAHGRKIHVNKYINQRGKTKKRAVVSCQPAPNRVPIQEMPLTRWPVPKIPKQYEIWFAELGNHYGTSVQSGNRPVLVISNDMANRNSPIITVRKSGKEEPIMALIPLYEAKTYLRVDSSDEDALIGILLSSAEQMCKDVGRLSEDQWEAVNAADRDAENGVQPTRELEALRSTCRVAILYALGYLYEHRDEADHKQLMLTLRSILFAVREGVF